MGITRRKAGGSGAAAVDVSSQEYQQLALTLGEKELEIRKLTEEKSEYKRKYEDLYSSVLKALADGVGRGAPPPAAAAASGARAQDNKDKEDGLQDKNFPLKVHRRLSKPVVADSSGKIHEKVEDPSDRKKPPETRSLPARQKNQGGSHGKARRRSRCLWRAPH